jgi:hypothetical protein
MSARRAADASGERSADDVLINYRPHDCEQCGCGEWMPIVGAQLAKHQTTTSH